MVISRHVRFMENTATFIENTSDEKDDNKEKDEEFKDSTEDKRDTKGEIERNNDKTVIEYGRPQRIKRLPKNSMILLYT